MALSEKRKKYLKEYRKRQRQKLLNYFRNYRKKNHKKILKYFKEYRDNNKEAMQKYHHEYGKKYKTEHKEDILKYNANYRTIHRDDIRKKSRIYQKKYYEKNCDKIRPIANINAKLYRKENKEKVKLAIRQWYDKHKTDPVFKAKQKIRHKQYLKDHRNEARIWHRQWHKKQMETNPNYRINKSMSSGIRISLCGNKHGRHWEDLVGYTLEDLKRHLESLFDNKMRWQNYGKNGWNIDHVIPKSLFKYNSYDDDEFKQCWALCNLQPLWEKDNLLKSNKI
jgi:hypothetical protein